MADQHSHPLSGKKARPEDLFSKEQIAERYFHPQKPLAPIKNGTSGHRGQTGIGFS